MPSEDSQTSPLRPIDEVTGQPIEPDTLSPQSAPGSASPSADAAGQNSPESAQQSTDDATPESPGLSTAASQQDIGSPIKRQHRDERLEPDYFPAKILFLNGTLKGLELDLGIAINEVSNAQSANFETPTEEGIRSGTNFKQVSPRSFSFKLEFFDITSDIQHLSENVFHLQEIDPTIAAPPDLMLILGDATIAPCRCTSLKTSLSEPHAKQKGFRYGVIEIDLEMAGGASSEHALAKPLLSTPLGDIRAAQTEAERQRQGELQVVKLLFEDCLGEEGSDEIVDLLENEQLNDVGAIAALSPNTFIQGAIAGFFDVETLSNQQIQEKLVQDLATVVARNENGIKESDQDAFANALLTGDLSGLPDFLREQAVRSQGDYQGALEAIASQDYSAILDQPSTAGDKLRRFGSCGLGMRQVSSNTLNQQGSEAQVLQAMVDFLGGPVGGEPPTDDEVFARFGELSPEQLRALRNGAPYQNKAEFITHLSQGGMGSISGYALWSNFVASQPAQPELPVEEEEAISG